MKGPRPLCEAGEVSLSHDGTVTLTYVNIAASHDGDLHGERLDALRWHDPCSGSGMKSGAWPRRERA